jgi:hypothetical protein
MKKESLLMVASKAASLRKIHRKICAIAPKIFGKARVHVLRDEHEVGWPGAPNFMLKSALEHVETHFRQDVFLLEPDAIPTSPTWWDKICSTWNNRPPDKHFMGAYVDYDIPHMTGIGVYGASALEVAPKLGQVQKQRGWDVFAADQILPHALLTKLIQHKWWRRAGQTNYEKLTVNDLEEQTVVFHQDKEGKLFKLLDQEYFSGEADETVNYSEHFSEELVSEMRYFKANNLSKSIDSQGINFNDKFQPINSLAGVWYGVLATQNEAEVLALLAIGGSVKEITQAEYEEMTKKKAPPSLSTKESLLSPGLAEPNAKINLSPAVLVEGRGSPSEQKEGEPVTPGNLVEDIEKVLKIGKVKPLETVKRVAPKSVRRGRRKDAV